MDLKIYEVCRGCMNNKNDGPDVNEFSEMSDKTVEMFTFCTSIKVLKDDGLPLNICQKCMKNIQICYNFINICKATDEALKFYLIQNQKEKSQMKQENELIVKDIKEENNDTFDNVEDQLNYFPIFDTASNDIPSEPEIKSQKEKRHEKSKVKLKKENIVSNIVKDDENQNVSDKKTNQLRKPYKCPVCEMVVKGRNRFNKHLREEHDGYKQYVCKFCKKAFARSHYLQQHEVTHTGERPWKCDTCNKTYKYRGQLTTHKRLHTPEKLFSCDRCPLTFTIKCSWLAHSKLHHGEEPNLCHLCGAGFAQAGNLRVHMRTHTGEKPYKCSICPFRCSVQSGMKRHERTHANLKGHKCPVCQKGFNNNSSMVRHIRIHTGELPYKCDFCPKAFIDNWKRKNHLVKMHNVALENIPKMLSGRRRKYINDKPITPVKETGLVKNSQNTNSSDPQHPI